ncbi:hypothetical protein PU629_04635 [Pullulanibacillus sp. KACC 23026]|uniref:hypothetical protein n=1 Tax=Pullulanibacillus sp. KACC 23026 TaxID=3028315 RepID=UPI0023AF00CF|nr:hypothetical protein [Pullulanibacillus sp. KACC 23026]WEG13657.1 hypothetical protein PU629_04635 [Pullulanibacillus sp. KACC 23026]
MLKEPVVATMLLLALIAFGEFISIKTRARVPMLLIVLVGYLVLLWIKVIPQDLVDNSTMSTVGGVLVAPLIVHMGTLIPMKIIRQQWRSVIIALLGVVISGVIILLVVSPIFGYDTAAAGVGPLTGGIIAYVVTSTKLKALGLTAIVAIPALVLSLQSLIGLPLSAFFLRKYATKLKANMGPIDKIAATIDPVIEEPARKSWIPDKYATQTILLFQLFIGGAIAVILGDVTGINYSIWALIIGLIGTLVGFYRDKMLERANSFGVAMLGVIFVVIPSMNSVTFSLFIHNLPAVLVILVVGSIGIILGGIIGGKLLGWDITKSIPVALTAMFGFPGDFLVSEEVSRSVGETKEEQEYLFKELLSPMIVGGFTTVTIASIVIASILMNTL